MTITQEVFVSQISNNYADQIKLIEECTFPSPLLRSALLPMSFFFPSNSNILLAYTAIIVVFALLPDLTKIAEVAQTLFTSKYVWIGNSELTFLQNVYPTTKKAYQSGISQKL